MQEISLRNTECILQIDKTIRSFAQSWPLGRFKTKL
jgi:hypothetical protein